MKPPVINVVSAVVFIFTAVIELMAGNAPAALGFSVALLWVGIDYLDTCTSDDRRREADAWHRAADRWREAYDLARKTP